MLFALLQCSSSLPRFLGHVSWAARAILHVWTVCRWMSLQHLQVLAGNKYVLRADILFQRADELVSPHVPFHHPSPSTGEVM